VEYEGAAALEVRGNECKRGIAYAGTEISNPTRMLTTTVKINGGRLPVAPVKSAAPVPKSAMLECMKVINKVRLEAPVRIGDVAVRDILGMGIDIVVTNDC